MRTIMPDYNLSPYLAHITADIRLRFALPKFGKAELRISASHHMEKII